MTDGSTNFVSNISPVQPEFGVGKSFYLDLVLLSLRVVLGLIFFAQGMTKLGWFGGTDPAGLDGMEQFLQILGYESTTALAWILTAAEIGTGVLLVIGLFTPLAAAGVIGIALNGIFALSWSGGFIAYNGWLGYAASAVAIAFLGPGRFAFDSIAPVQSLLGSRRLLVGPRAALLAILLGVAAGVIVLTVFGPGFFSEPNFPEFG